MYTIWINFVTVQLFDDTPPVLSLGQLCEDHGFSYECTVSHVPLQVPVQHHDRSYLHHKKKHEATGCAIPCQVHYRDEFGGGRDPLQDLPQWLKDFTEHLEDESADAVESDEHGSSEPHRPVPVPLVRGRTIY